MMINNPDRSFKLDVEYYGADFPVELLVKRMRNGDFIIPEFQRDFVWSEENSSKFIESLLIGIPIPSLFLAKDKTTSKYIVLDGQQRLKTLQYFYDGYFPNGKIFRLSHVIDVPEGLTYKTLSTEQKLNLDDALIHCIIIAESYDAAGIFYIFERINTTGTRLNPQEIRNAVYHGRLSQTIQQLSSSEDVALLYGNKMRDSDSQENILRFFAFLFEEKYEPLNMVEFLNRFMLKNQNPSYKQLEEMRTIFNSSIKLLKDCLGEKAFIRNSRFDKTIHDSLMIIAAKRPSLSCSILEEIKTKIINDDVLWKTHNPISRINHVISNYPL